MLVTPRPPRTTRTDTPCPCATLVRAAQLNRFLPCQRDGKGRIGSLEQMVSLIENDPRGPVARLPRIIFDERSDEHTSELQSLMCISHPAFLLKRTNTETGITQITPL